MVHLCRIIPYFLFGIFYGVFSLDIDCEFRKVEFTHVYVQYTCKVENHLNITFRCNEINSTRGIHEGTKINDNVKGISIENKKIHYLPKNLGDKFKNLIAVRVKHGRLKEIRKSDLKQFPKLEHLNLDQNDIEHLEEGLFEYNPDLILIWFDSNKIKNIGETTFKNLKALKSLDLTNNTCFSKRIQNEMTINLALITKACYNAACKIVFEDPDIACQVLEKDTKLEALELELANKDEMISKLQNQLFYIEQQKEVQEKLRREIDSKSLGEKTSKHFWTLLVGLALNFVFLIVNVVFVWKF